MLESGALRQSHATHLDVNARLQRAAGDQLISAPSSSPKRIHSGTNSRRSRADCSC